ncbi:MAG: hypothetical protein R3D51_16185 [Hyphomicrobiaceae bacterium]
MRRVVGLATGQRRDCGTFAKLIEINMRVVILAVAAVGILAGMKFRVPAALALSAAVTLASLCEGLISGRGLIEIAGTIICLVAILQVGYLAGVYGSTLLRRFFKRQNRRDSS